MNNLEELKRKYEELGKEIERLEKERLEKEKSCKRWRAEQRQFYYFVDEDGEIDSVYEQDDITDRYNFKTRNYFKTRKEAQRLLDNIKTYYELMDLAEELNNGEKNDWNDTKQKKYYICYDCYNEGIVLCNHYNVKDIGQIYCLDKNFAAIALERIGKERLEKLFKEE